MSKSTKGLRNAGLASLAIALTLGAGALGAGAANAVEGFSFDRIDGDNRYDTSALIADEYNETNPHVILAPGEHGKYADALTANYLSGALEAPILLTREGFTPKPVLQQLKDQGTERITVVGGAGVISEEQVAALEDEGYTVDRLSGPDRFDTNAAVIEHVETDAVDGTGLIATGFNFADALAGGPVTYQGHPLGLSTQNDIEDDVIDALKGAGVDKVYILGGEAAVGQAVVTKLEANGIDVVDRLAGSNRAATSVEIAEFAVDNLDFVDTHVGVASGYVEGSGADALAGGPLEGSEKSPMLVTRNENNPGEVLDYLEDHSDTLVDGHLYGGTVAITAAAEDAMTEAAQGDAPASNQDYAVSPAEAATNTVSTEPGTTNANRGARTYTVQTGDATSVDIALFDADNVTVDADGNVTFVNGGTATNRFADQGDVVAEVEVVGGVATSGDYVQNVTPTNGSVSFVVDSEQFDEVIPVVFTDSTATAANQLNLDANNEPTEAFGVGGQKTWIPTAAGTADDATDAEVVWVDKANDQFVVLEPNTDDDGTDDEYFLYTYEAGDGFRYDGTEATNTSGNTATMGQFETALSEGDIVDVDYSSTFVSIFNIQTDEPGTPTGLSATVGDFDDDSTDGADDVRLTWNAPNPADGLIASYNVAVNRDDTTTAACDGPAVTLTEAANGTTGQGIEDTEVVIEDLTVDDYCFTVTAVSGTDTPGENSDPAFAEVEPGVDEDAPIIDELAATRDVDTNDLDGDDNVLEANNVLDQGDRVRFVFDEAVVLGTNTTLEVTDDDGTVAEITRGQNATFQQSSDGTTVIVTLTGDPLVTDFGTDGDLDVDFGTGEDDAIVLTGATAIADTSGNALNVDAEDAAGDPIGHDLTINHPGETAPVVVP